MIALSEVGNQPDLTPALPLEYLERLILQNQLFGDDIRLEGIALEEGKTVIVTSQPVLIGDPPQEEDITGVMAQIWFKPLHGLHLGRSGSLAFYRDLDEVAAFDAHPGNFVKDEAGVVLPIRAVGPCTDWIQGRLILSLQQPDLGDNGAEAEWRASFAWCIPVENQSPIFKNILRHFEIEDLWLTPGWRS